MRKQSTTSVLKISEELGLQQRYMFRNGKSAVEDVPRKVEVGLKRREELNKIR